MAMTNQRISEIESMIPFVNHLNNIVAKKLYVDAHYNFNEKDLTNNYLNVLVERTDINTILFKNGRYISDLIREYQIKEDNPKKIKKIIQHKNAFKNYDCALIFTFNSDQPDIILDGIIEKCQKNNIPTYLVEISISFDYEISLFNLCDPEDDDEETNWQGMKPMGWDYE